MDYLEYLGRKLVWFVVSLVVVIVVKRPRLLKGLALVSDEVIGKINYFIFLTIAWLVLVREKRISHAQQLQHIIILSTI